MSTRRDKLVSIKQSATTHAGLWRDKYICEQRRDDTESRRTLVAEVAELSKGFNKDHLYQQFHARWMKTLADCDATCYKAKVQGRMVVGLGDESVLETSVALHRTYGVPYIPGSALKGLAARFVRERLQGDEWGKYEKNGDKEVWKPNCPYTALFGDTSSAGYITFFDALYVPGSGHNGQALWPDVITVHHPDYYRNDGVPPADWDSPTPIPFLSATGDYTIALAAPPNCEKWITLAFDILRHALRELGIGAKTSSGYGRMVLEGADTFVGRSDDVATKPSKQHPASSQINAEQARVEDFKQQIPRAQKNDVAQYVTRLEQLEVGQDAKRTLANELAARVRELNMKTEGKSWYQRLQHLQEK